MLAYIESFVIFVIFFKFKKGTQIKSTTNLRQDGALFMIMTMSALVHFGI